MSKTNEIGTTGLKVWAGTVNEEFIVNLQGPRGQRAFHQMAENDSTISAILNAIDLIVRAVDWKVTPADDSTAAKDKAEWAESILHDMDRPFEDTISEAMTMLVYGWSYFEQVLRKRTKATGSTEDDGTFGLKKLAPRSQDTLERWEMSPRGDILGLWQQPVHAGPPVFIPIHRALHFRTRVHKNNPEGKSILRSAYRPWYLLKTIQDSEAIGIERELAGLPVAYIPSKYFGSGLSADEQAFFNAIKQTVRDVKFNEQGGVVLPSDTYPDADGNPSNTALVKLELLSSGGQRAIDPNEAILRYQKDMARSALADFIMLGTDGKGSYALSQDKTDLFLRAAETYLNRVALGLNRQLLPRLWEINGFDRELMPQYAPGRVAPVDLGEIGTFLEKLARAGAPLFPDEDLGAYVRDMAGLPEATGEAALQVMDPGATIRAPGSTAPDENVSDPARDDKPAAGGKPKKTPRSGASDDG